MKVIHQARFTFRYLHIHMAAYLLYFSCIILICIFGVKEVHANTTNNAETVDLYIMINEDQSISGRLNISFAMPPKDGTSFDIVLPFVVDKIYEHDDINYNLRYPSNYTLLTLSTSTNTKIHSEITFHINSPSTDEPQENSYLDQGPNTLIIEHRGGQYYVFHLRFDIKISDKPFKDASSFLNTMIIPSNIYVVFPENTIYYPWEPTGLSSNIYTGPVNAGDKNGNIFRTTTAFYQRQHLWINYILTGPPSKTHPSPYNNELTTIAFAFCSVGIVILSVPQELLSKENRMLASSIVNFLIIPLLIVSDIFIGGLTSFLNNLPSIVSNNVQGIVFYFTAVIVLSLNLSFINNFLIRLSRRSAPAGSAPAGPAPAGPAPAGSAPAGPAPAGPSGSNKP